MFSDITRKELSRRPLQVSREGLSIHGDDDDKVWNLRWASFTTLTS